MKFTPSKQVKEAINNKTPVLALESTIISSGMPYPKNIEFYNKASDICLRLGVVPATIAIIRGVICVGLVYMRASCVSSSAQLFSISCVFFLDFGSNLGLNCSWSRPGVSYWGPEVPQG